MRNAFLCVGLLLMSTVAAAAPDPYDVAMTGNCFSSRDWSTSYSGTLTNGSFEQFPVLLENVAEAPNGRLFGFFDFDLVELHPDRTITPLVAGVTPHAPIHMVVAANATTYLLAPENPPIVRAIAPNGTISEITLPLEPPHRSLEGGIDLAADQCTLYYRSNDFPSTTIRRFNLCTQSALPDFVVTDRADDVRVLPDGGVLAATVNGLRRYSAAGTLTHTYPTGPAGAIGLTAGGTVAIVSHPCNTPNLERVDLESGATTTIPFAELGTVDIVPYRSWTAAIGAANTADVPTVSTAALVFLGALIVFVAFARLR